MDIKQILEILPHRYPFLLVDKVLELEPFQTGNRKGRKIKALKNVSFNESFFQGHFPDNPIMPGVLLVEAMCQAAALACFRPTDPKVNFFIAKINSSRFRRPVYPGSSLILSAEVLKDRGTMIVIQCAIHEGGELTADAEIIAALQAAGGEKL